jgi:hypothetical protein
MDFNAGKLVDHEYEAEELARALEDLPTAAG